ncbi:uncharacterized protein LOC118438929 [Folsomia candida]|uniref:uncharacterized protein LOC118438929 n=1 Tax=Folsomia candida TaxID=158441 RepID=UPI001604BB69|nr:uncharacterized protein LOC118438929 [Folsomia candida]
MCIQFKLALPESRSNRFFIMQNIEGNIEEKLEIHENAYDKLNETIIAFKRCGFDKVMKETYDGLLNVWSKHRASLAFIKEKIRETDLHRIFKSDQVNREDEDVVK